MRWPLRIERAGLAVADGGVRGYQAARRQAEDAARMFLDVVAWAA